MTALEVLICGGGISEFSLAFWLAKIGCDITITELSSCLGASGQQIDMQGHGIQATKRVRLEQVFRTKVARETGVQFVDGFITRKASFPENQVSKGLQRFTYIGRLDRSTA